ncbi:MAG: prepilin-type N-terminal cleavage/methylation domain-containing protein [Gemmatimonadaceae bacterium]|nr:prepilin-type N-terminal cleavage/methylation domain-containing protein [Gemmatimonadaceae bacterium]
MLTGTVARVPTRRSGMTLIEVIIAVMILSGVLIGLSNFTRRFQHLTNNHDALATASELATARLEAVKLHRTYSTLVSTFNGTTETSATSTANPSMSGFPDYTRTTSAVAVDSAYAAKYVTVSHTPTGTSVSKSLVIAAF